MNKSKTIIILLVVVIILLGAVAFLSYQNADSISKQQEAILNYLNKMNPEINRTPVQIYEWDKTLRDYDEEVTIYYKNDVYYHNDYDCCFAITKDGKDWLDISRYEAEERGFKPCPNCYINKVRIKQN